MAKEKLTWSPLDLSSVKGDTKKQYQAVLDAAEALRAAKEPLEKTLAQALEAAKKIPDGKRPVFLFKHGKYLVAFASPSATSSGSAIKL